MKIILVCMLCAENTLAHALVSILKLTANIK